MNEPRIFNTDCLTALRDMPDESVHAVVCDPPYGLSEVGAEKLTTALTAWVNGDRERVPTGKGFMGKEWDAFVPPPAVWDECLRVLKPGGHMLVFAGSRTVDLMGLSIRLAGFEIRDTLQWLYGSGFPKSHNVHKSTGDDRFAGWGTALKPAAEPIILARKPLSSTSGKTSTVARNVLAHGTGGINVDGCRVGSGDNLVRPLISRDDNEVYGKGLGAGVQENPAGGRFPANVVLSHSEACDDESCDDGCAVAELDAQSGVTKSHGQSFRSYMLGGGATYQTERVGGGGVSTAPGGDSGGASRFFASFRYQAKAPTRERPKVDGVSHPTVKPVALMRWLVRLVTPPGGTVLDPFAGSGTTLQAASEEGFESIGIEREAEYIPLISARLGEAA